MSEEVCVPVPPQKCPLAYLICMAMTRSDQVGGHPIGYLHDGAILPPRPECFIKMLSYSNICLPSWE